MNPNKIREIMLETSKSFYNKGLREQAKELESMAEDYSRAIHAKVYEVSTNPGNVLVEYVKTTIIEPKILAEALKNQKKEESEKWALNVFLTKNIYLAFETSSMEKAGALKKQKEKFYLN